MFVVVFVFVVVASLVGYVVYSGAMRVSSDGRLTVARTFDAGFCGSQGVRVGARVKPYPVPLVAPLAVPKPPVVYRGFAVRER